MRLARNELKIAIAAMCLLVLFAAVYLVFALTGDNGTPVANAGDEPTTEGEVDDTDPVVEADPVPLVEDDAVDPFETEPAVDPAVAGDAWDDLFAGSDGPSMMETPGGADTHLDLTDGGADDFDADVEPDLARLSAGTTDLPDTPADTPADNSAVEDDAAPNFSGPRIYVVKQGDSFYTIARDQLGDANLYLAIERANPLIDPKRIRPGMEIKLPDPSELSSGNGSRASTTEADITLDGHVVKAGETLSDIALLHYGKSHLWRDIYEANRDKLESPNRLRVGVVLTIPELVE